MRYVEDLVDATIMTFSPDGSRLAVGDMGGGIRLLVAGSVETRDCFTGHNQAILCQAFTPDGALLATGSRDRTIRLWDTVIGQELLTLEGHTGAVCQLRFTPDSAALVSVGDGPNGTEVFHWNTGRTWAEQRDATQTPGIETIRGR